MTTKFKIIFGFSCMIVILLIMSALGYNYMRQSLLSLDAYQRNVRITVALGNTLGALNEARSQMNRYLAVPTPAIMENAQKALDVYLAEIEIPIKEAVVPENSTIAQAIRDDGKAYKDGLDALAAAVTRLHDAYTNGMRVPSREITERTATLRQAALEVGNEQVLADLGIIWNDYAYMVSALGRYLYSRSDENMKIVRQYIAAITPTLEKMGGRITLAKNKEFYEDMVRAFKTVVDAVATMENAAKDTQATVDALRELRASIITKLDELDKRFEGQMRATGASLVSEIESGENTLLGGGIGGLLAGLLLALFAISGLLRALRESSAFARAVSLGNFTYIPNVKEGGEIGAMITAMREIPAVLQRLVSGASSLSNEVLSGHLRNRLDASGFSGSFVDLAGAVNSVGEAYTRVIDNMGVPLMCCDRGYAITFLSQAAQQVVGGDLCGKRCADELKASACNTSQCLGNCAMERKGKVASETDIHPRGLSVDVAVVSVPLQDIQGATVGFMEVLTDITEVKAKQKTIVRVAVEADHVSVGVATASEEVASQMKHISEGMEMQRDQINSTATAMTEMNATVLEVAKNAGEASEQSEQTRVKAQEGAALVNQVVTAINAVNAVGQNLQTNMQELGKQAQNIGNVMNVISDIADQTNLLALNAAIEAARAGEAGRGFAVVADEVRKLAEKTMQATQEVGSSIDAVQKSVSVNITEVGKAVASVAEANTLANSSGEALQEIVAMAASNSTFVASIATAAEEQSATSEEINQAIDEINKIAANSAESIAQSASAVHTLSDMAQQLRRVIDGLQ